MIRLLLALCTVCFSLFVSEAQVLRYGIDITMSKTNFIDTISVEWQHEQLLIPVKAGGKTLHFLLDTGAGSSVTYTDAPIHGSKKAGMIPTVDVLGHRDTVPVMTLPPLTIGTVTYSNLQSTVQRRTVKQTGIDGILGFDLFASGLTAKIDVKRKHIIITDRRDLFDSETACDVRYIIKYHTPYLRLSPFGKYKEEACFDTGSRQIYMMNRQSLSKGEEHSTPQALDGLVEGRVIGRHAIGHSGTEAYGEVVFLHLKQLSVGELILSDLHAITIKGNSHLGAALLNYTAVIIDTKRKKLRFQPYGSLNECHIDNKQLEIAFVPERGRAAVGLVWPQGTPYKRGMREGDIITAIDGRPVADFRQFVNWHFQRGREYTFTVADRQGRIRQVKWVRLP